MITTAAEFTRARHLLDLSVSQCARLCGVDDRTLRKWERDGDRPPHPSACRLLELCLIDPHIRLAALTWTEDGNAI